MIYKIDITELWNHSFKKIDTPDGYQNIKAIVKKPRKVCYAVMFSNNNVIECSEDHLFQDIDNNWVSVKDLKDNTIIKHKHNNVRVVSKLNIGIQDTYDLSVDHSSHRYYSDNIVSHNTGKTSSAIALIKEINGEALFINASMDRGIDVLRNQISNFASTESFDGKLKIVIMDECDSFSPDAQLAFRALIESFANNCRFIFTANFKEKIIEPLIDRLECYDFNAFDKKIMVKPIFEHLKEILNNEKIKYEPKDLVPIINTFYPSIRGMVGALQKFSVNGTLSIDVNDLDDQNEYQKIIDLVLKKDFIGTINAVNNLSSPDNMYTFMYKKLSNFKNITSTVIILAKYQFQSSSVRDKNLNLSACLTELMSTI